MPQSAVLRGRGRCKPAAEVVLSLSLDDWLLIQVAVDTAIYETEHQGPWTTRPHREALRERRAERLHHLNRLIGTRPGAASCSAPKRRSRALRGGKTLP